MLCSVAQNYLTSHEESTLEMCLGAHGCQARIAYVRVIATS